MTKKSPRGPISAQELDEAEIELTKYGLLKRPVSKLCVIVPSDEDGATTEETRL